MQDPAPLQRLRQRYPWPSARPNVPPIAWTLDGGGRRLIDKAIRNRRVKLILEIGSWLGGSVKRWLNISPDVVVIAVDPWNGKLCDFARRFRRPDWVVRQLEADDGPYHTFMANLWNERDRVIPVRGSSPDALYDLHRLGVVPDLIYLDADKSGREIPICHDLFATAVLTGDDWDWGESFGYPIRKPVREFCDSHQSHLMVDYCTWVISPEPPPIDYHVRQVVRQVRSFVKQTFRAPLPLQPRAVPQHSAPQLTV